MIFLVRGNVVESYSLMELASEQITVARSAPHGRSARTILGGRHHRLRQTILALAAGHGLADHEAPRDTTLQVLIGHVRLDTAEESWEGWAGDFLVIPTSRHSLDAVEDSSVLLTVGT